MAFKEESSIEKCIILTLFLRFQKRSQIWVIVKKSSPKNLSADCRPTVGRQLTDSQPTVYRQVKKKEKLC